MHTDSHYTIGSSHDVCQDYTAHGDSPFPYAIVSDGCSASQGVDVGARLIAHAARSLITSGGFVLARPDSSDTWLKCLGTAVISLASAASQSLGLDDQCLDATLLLATLDGGTFRVWQYGDGLVCWEDTAGRRMARELHYPMNAPFYLSYLCNQERLDTYVAMAEKVRQAFGMTGRLVTWDLNTGEEVSSVDHDPTRWLGMEFPADATRWVAVCSDGLSSARCMDSPPSTGESAGGALAFKTVAGSFVKRRLGRWLKDSKKAGVEFYDDISVACIMRDGL